MDRYLTPLDYSSHEAPERPVFCARPTRAAAAADWFRRRFPGDVFYAVKANPAPWLIKALHASGVPGFDIASEAELELVGGLCPTARLAFMHPVKSRRAIARAYHEFGCRAFALDHPAELAKIREATGDAKDLTLVVRAAAAGSGAILDQAGKFGAAAERLPDLLRETRRYADELGVSFLVGSQCLSPEAYRAAMANASALITQATATVDIVDVGGGFPAAYPGHLAPPPLERYITAIEEAFEPMMVLENADLWCEPGRALAAEAESLLVRVEHVRDGAVYLNDGAYGALYDAAHETWRYPVRALGRGGRRLSDAPAAFTAYGPTCDAADVLHHPLDLPRDVAEGDYIEFGHIGAYGRTMATRFNGFGSYETIEVQDAPFASLYGAGGDIAIFPSAASSTGTA